MKASKKLYGVLALTLMAVLSSCGDGEDRCFTCTLNATVVNVCESNYKQQAAQNNVDVSSLNEYISLIRPTGFVCIEQ